MLRAIKTCRRGSFYRAYLVCFPESANTLYISRQCTYIMFILQCKKKRKKRKNQRNCLNKMKNIKYCTVGTVSKIIKSNRKKRHRNRQSWYSQHTITWALTILAWYRPFNKKSGRVKLALWARIFRLVKWYASCKKNGAILIVSRGFYYHARAYTVTVSPWSDTIIDVS